MNSFKIALMNFRNNLKAYGLHMATMIFSVMTYYNFAALKYNPEALKSEEASGYIEGTAQATSFLFVMFLVFFIWFSSSFFLSQRKREIGIYAFLGIEIKRIGFIFSVESFIQGITAIGAGLFLGLLTSKLFMMLLSRMALLNVTITFFFSIKGLIETVVVFVSVFVLASLKEFITISRSQLINLFNAASRDESIPKKRIIPGIASILVIGGTYYNILTTERGNISSAMLITVVLTTVGTFMLFGSFLPLLVGSLVRFKRFMYRGVNIISISNLAFRIRRNYKTLAAMTILITASITTLSTVTSLKFFVNSTHSIELPYSFSYINEEDDSSLNRRVEEMIKDAGHSILLNEHVELLYAENVPEFKNIHMNDAVIIKYTDFIRILEELKAKGYEKIRQNVVPGEDEIIYVEKPGVVLSISFQETGNIVALGGSNLTISESVKLPLFGGGLPLPGLVVSDSTFDSIRKGYKKLYFYGLIVDNPEYTWNLAMDLKSIPPLNQYLYSYIEVFKLKYDLFGILYFMGAFLSIVFVFATGSIMYFKLLGDAAADKSKYDILRKIGMTDRETSLAVSRQVSFSFSIPLIIGIIHSIVATMVLKKLMNYSLFIPSLISIAVFAAIYALFYFATTRKFLKTIKITGQQAL